MKKRKWNNQRPLTHFTLLALCLLLMASLAGCGGSPGQTPVSIDIDKLASELLDGVPFQDQMSEVDSSVFSMLYSLNEEDVESEVLICSTGATAEEIAVIHAAPDKTDAVKEAIKGRIEAQKEGFENYVPGEMDKLSDPVMVQVGDYFILCVTDDNAKAEEIIKPYLQ